MAATNFKNLDYKALDCLKIKLMIIETLREGKFSRPRKGSVG